MHRTKKRPIASVTIVSIFLIILFLPGFGLKIVSFVTGNPMDVTLNGYTDSVNVVSANTNTWFSGELQQYWSKNFEEKLKPRGLMVKTYNTINFLLFNESLRIIGKNRDIFELQYINAELVLTDADDFSIESNVREMSNFVQLLREVREKLNCLGKELLVYVAPSKAAIFPENIPDRYFLYSREHARSVDVFRQEIEKTDVPYLICSDLLEKLTYPPFYTTGIHWSRTYEQYASHVILERMAQITGNQYGNIEWEKVESSKKPFLRDSDVLDLANVFYRPDVTYYKYKTHWTEGEENVPIRLLLQGDSFSIGLMTDIQENNTEAEVHWISRNNTMQSMGEVINFKGDWAQLDLQHYLEKVDIVVVEIVEPLLKNYSFGFVQALSEVLENSDIPQL